MQRHYRAGLHPRDEEEYEQEYDDYEEGSEDEEEDEKEEPANSKEQQEFLSLREQLKEKFRQKLKKQTPRAFGRQSLVGKKPTANDNFGSFFGPSKPVIASRVLDERRSIQETNHVVSQVPRSTSGCTKSPTYTTSEKKAHVQNQQAKVINEVKKKVQTLKDTRDYSFLFSDDADFPVPDKEHQRQPAVRKPVPNSDGRSAQASSKVKATTGKPILARPVPNCQQSKTFEDGRSAQASSKVKASTGKPILASPVPNCQQPKTSVAKRPQLQTRVGPVKGAVMRRPREASEENRKFGSDNDTNGSKRPIGHKFLTNKVSAMATGNRPPVRTMNDPSLKKKVPSALPHPSSQRNHYSGQKRPSERHIIVAPKQPVPSSKPQMKPSQKIPVRGGHEVRLKKKPVKKRSGGEDDEDAIQMIRNMFRYNPSKYVGNDEDDSDMEADFRTIQKEERISSKIAKREDEEQLLLIEEEERRERMRKKQKLSRR